MIKKLLPQSLFGRFLLIIITPVILLQVLSIYLFYDRHWDRVTRRLAISVAGDIAMLYDLMELHPIGSQNFAETINRAEQNFEFDISFQENVVLQPTTSLDLEDEIVYYLYDEISKRLGKDAFVRHDQAQELIHIYLPYYLGLPDLENNLEPSGVVEIVTTEKRVFSSTTYIFVMWIIAMAVILYAIAIVFMRNQIRPIRKLSQAADALGRGDDIEDLKPNGAREVRQAAIAFKRMKDRLQRQVRQRTNMLSGVSHDLRTPLTRIKLQLALIKDPKQSDGKQMIESDITEMEQLIEGYLSYVRGEEDEEPQPTNLSSLLKSLIEKANQGRIDASIGKNINLTAKLQLLSRGIGNVLNNALQYASKVHVTLALTKDQHHAVITIEDDGPGIPSDQYEDVFQPFFRLEQSRNQGTGGVGLGLAITRDAIRAHAGTIELSRADKLGGLKVTIRLPMTDH